MTEKERSKISEIYSGLFDTVKRKLMRFGCNEELARDIYDECFRIYIEKIKKTKVNNPEGFIIKVAGDFWLDNLKKKYAEDNYLLYSTGEMVFDPAVEEDMKERMYIYKKCLKKLDKNCRKIIEYEVNDYALESIAYRMGYRSKRQASQAKYNCKQKLRKLIKKEQKNKIYYGK